MTVSGITMTKSDTRPMLHMMKRVSPAPFNKPIKVKYIASKEMNIAIILNTTTP